MVTVKICGLTSAADAMLAAEAGADFFGFVFAPGSPRQLQLPACLWIRALPVRGKVGVFRNQEEAFIREVWQRADLDLVQLHGQEDPELCARLGGRERVIKAISVVASVDWEEVRAYAPVARILFDTAGGSGKSFPWELLRQAPPDLPFWLAGGLQPGNVAQAIALGQPAGVDVASGVESAPGKKDPVAVRSFIAAVRRACEAIS
jgi:phosphoribosylanthranilate isomerase